MSFTMAAKLRSILGPIRWSLVFRAALFAGAWFLLPSWAFVLVALYLYIVPRFRSVRFSFPFLVLLFLLVTEPPHILGAAFAAVAGYLLFGTKDMVFMEKRMPYAALILLLVFLMCVRFFSRFGSWDRPEVFIYAGAVGAVFFLLCRGFLLHVASLKGRAGNVRRGLLGFGVAAILVWELLLTTVFLPLNFLYQSAFLFIAAAVLFDVALDYAHEELLPRKMLLDFSAFFAFLVILLGLAKWTL